MKTHITTLNNMAGTASLAHRRVLKVAQSIGCHEMGLSFYPLKPDYAKEIDKHLDGIIAPLNYGDIVIFQYPSWIGVNYDESFVNKIKSYRDTKLIIFVQDIQKLMFDSEQAILDMEIKTLNKADLLILPSKKMHRYLKENGLDEKPVIYQTIWDMPSDICFVDHAVTRCFHFAGNYNRFPFLAEYHGKTPIYQYDANKPDRENDDSFCWRGYFEQEKLMHELSKGGFGLVWSDDEYFDRYYSMNQPYKLGTNLAAGIPVIVGGLIGLRQNAVKNAGETLGFKEMSLFKFPDAYDSDDELHVRMDGIIASLCPEDIVIFQHPSGESPRYDGFLFEHLRRYHGTKIVAFIQEIASDRDDSEYALSDEITLLNRADMFIFASAALRDYYIANGLKEKPYLIQNIPDYMTDICANEHKNKKLYIMAETSQNEYPLNNLNIEVVQYDEYRAMESILRLSDGGFGLIWDADEQALGLYMAAGIPVIVKKGLSCEKYVTDNEIGAAATDFEDVYRIAVSESEDKLSQYYANVKKLQNLFINGIYTRKLLLDTLIMCGERL